jgi:hypothetical protein
MGGKIRRRLGSVGFVFRTSSPALRFLFFRCSIVDSKRQQPWAWRAEALGVGNGSKDRVLALVVPCSWSLGYDHTLGYVSDKSRKRSKE